MFFSAERGYALRILGVLLVASILVKGQSSNFKHANIGVLVDLHEPGVGGVDKQASCGRLNVHSYQKLKSVEWAVEIINNKSWPGEFSLGLSVHDTCGESAIALSETGALLQESKRKADVPLIGLVVIGSGNNERIIDRPLMSLNNENISAVVTSAKAAGLLLASHPNVFTTAPDLSNVVEGIVALVNQLGASTTAVISSSLPAVKKFEKLISTKPVKMTRSLVIGFDEAVTLRTIVEFLNTEAEDVQSIVLLLESSDLESLVTEGDVQVVEEFQKQIAQKAWILGSIGMNSELIRDWSSKFHSNLLVMQPRATINSDFKHYFVDHLMKLANVQDVSATEYLEMTYNCKGINQRHPNPLLHPCTTLDKSFLINKLPTEGDIGFIVNAISAYSAALRLAQIGCSNETQCETQTLSGEVLNALKSLNFPTKDVEPNDGESTVSTSHELEGAQRRINYHGKLISRKYDLHLCRTNGKLTQIGHYSHEDGLILHVMLGMKAGEDSAALNDNALVSPESSRIADSASNTNMRRGKTVKMNSQTQQYLRQNEEYLSVTRMSPPEIYISRVWAMAATAVSVTGVFIALYILVYVLQRMCDGTLRGNQVLGILLLLGIISMYSSVVLFVLPPGSLLCNMRVFLPSTATTLCFGILLLKGMQLRYLVSLGLGGRVPALNQFITLFFVVAVQLAINLQWFFGPHESNITTRLYENSTDDFEILECFYSHHSFLHLHAYVGLLILIVFVYGTSVLKIRRNYNEAKWITLASCLSLPVAVAWVVTVQMGPSNFQEPAACIVFIALATVLLFAIFIPKLNTINQQSKFLKRKQTLKGAGLPGYNTGSISTIFTTVSDRGTLQSHLSQHKRNPSQQPYGHHPPPPSASTYVANPSAHVVPPAPPPLMSHSSTGKSVTYSPRLTTNFYPSSSTATSLARSSGSMKTPFFDPGRSAYP